VIDNNIVFREGIAARARRIRLILDQKNPHSSLSIRSGPRLSVRIVAGTLRE